MSENPLEERTSEILNRALDNLRAGAAEVILTSYRLAAEEAGGYVGTNEELLALAGAGSYLELSPPPCDSARAVLSGLFTHLLGEVNVVAEAGFGRS